MIKILNLKLVIELSEYQNRKTFLLKDIALCLRKLKIQFHEHMFLMILKVKKLLERFMQKNCKRQTNKNLE